MKRAGAVLAMTCVGVLVAGIFTPAALAAPLSLTFTEGRANVGNQLDIEQDALFKSPETATLEAQIDPATGAITEGKLSVPVFSTHIEEPIDSDVMVEFDIGVISGTFDASTGALSLSGSAAGVLTAEGGSMEGTCAVSVAGGDLTLSTAKSIGGSSVFRGMPFTAGLAGNGAIAGEWEDMLATALEGTEDSFCENVEDEIGGKGGIWLERKDIVPPEAPQLRTDPVSPDTEGSPRIKGTAEAGSTVKVYASSSCIGAPVATGSAAEFSSPGLAVSVVEEVTATFSATATDAAGNTSPCSKPISYTRLKAKTDPAPGTKTSGACVKAERRQKRQARQVNQARKRVVRLRKKARTAKSAKRSAGLRVATRKAKRNLKRKQNALRQTKAKAKRACS